MQLLRQARIVYEALLEVHNRVVLRFAVRITHPLLMRAGSVVAAAIHPAELGAQGAGCWVQCLLRAAAAATHPAELGAQGAAGFSVCCALLWSESSHPTQVPTRRLEGTQEGLLDDHRTTHPRPRRRSRHYARCSRTLGFANSPQTRSAVYARLYPCQVGKSVGPRRSRDRVIRAYVARIFQRWTVRRVHRFRPERDRTL
jgi:hypothetical protein